MSARYPHASTRCPTTDTILKWCSDYTAIQVLTDRGLLTELEADGLRKRARDKSDAFYGRVYGEATR